MSDDLHRAIGAHDADIETLKKSMTEIAADVKAIRTKMDEASGGWRTIMWLAGVAGTMGGAIGWLLSLLQHKPDIGQ